MIASAEIVGRVLRREHDGDDGGVFADPVWAVVAVRYEGAEEVTAVRPVVFTPHGHPLELPGRQSRSRGRRMGRIRVLVSADGDERLKLVRLGGHGTPPSAGKKEPAYERKNSRPRC